MALYKYRIIIIIIIITVTFLFNIYLDSIIVALKQADNGCHMGGVYTGCLAYAVI